MRTFSILFIKELRSFFLSPMAYVVMGLFAFLNGWLFLGLVRALEVRASPRGLVHNLLTSGWFWMAFLILFPLVTMRLFADERRMGTIEGLLTAPVRTVEVILAKYAAALTAYAVIVLPVILFFPLFRFVTGDAAAFHNGAVLGGAAGLFLVGAFHVAIGTLASALTANPLIAAMATFVCGVFHYFLGYLQAFGLQPGSGWAEGLAYFSTVEHMGALSEGLLDSRAAVYYLSFSALLLSLTHHVLESRKWRA